MLGDACEVPRRATPARDDKCSSARPREIPKELRELSGDYFEPEPRASLLLRFCSDLGVEFRIV